MHGIRFFTMVTETNQFFEFSYLPDSSWRDPGHCPRKEARRADVLEAPDPPGHSLNTHAESRMGGHPKPAEVEVPGEGLRRKVLALYPLEEGRIFCDPLPPCSQLAKASGRYEIGRLSDIWPVLVGHVVEGACRE